MESSVQNYKNRPMQDEAASDSGQSMHSDVQDDEQNRTNEMIQTDKFDLTSSKDNSNHEAPELNNAIDQKGTVSKQTEKDQLKKSEKIQITQNETQQKESLRLKNSQKKQVRKKQKRTKQQKQKGPKSERKTNKTKTAKQKSQSKQLLQSFDQQWDAKQIESDQGESLISDEDQAENDQDQQKTAFLQDEDINNLSVMNQQDQMNNAYIEKEMNVKYEHWVENKHLIVLYLLFRKEIYDLFPKNLQNRIDIHPANKNKIRIFGTTQQEVKQVSSKISQIINKIAILKLNIRNEEAFRLKSSRLLNKKLLKDKMIIFKFGNSGDKSYYLGGKGTQPQLALVFKDIRNLKFRYFRMFDFPNTRSYKIILGNIIKQKEFLKAFSKWNLKHLQIVPYIPNFSSSNSRKEQQKCLCFLMTTIGNFDNFSPKEIQYNMLPFIKNNFYTVVLIFRKGDKYFPKLSVEGVFFKYVSERKLPWGYVYIMSLKKTFFEKRNEIIKEVEKLSERKLIFGTRFFNNLSPQRSEYIKPDIYKQVKYPQDRPAYSYSIIARQIKEQVKISTFQQDEKESEMKQKQIEPKKYYTFDWKEHLLNLQSTDITFIQDSKV